MIRITTGWFVVLVGLALLGLLGVVVHAIRFFA